MPDLPLDPVDLEWFFTLVDTGHRELYHQLMQYDYETHFGFGKPRKKPYKRPKNWETRPIDYQAYKVTTIDSTQRNEGYWLGEWADGLEMLWFRYVGEPSWEEDYSGLTRSEEPDRWMPLMYFNDRPAWNKFQADLQAQTDAAQRVHEAENRKLRAAAEKAEYERLKKKFEKK